MKVHRRMLFNQIIQRNRTSKSTLRFTIDRFHVAQTRVRGRTLGEKGNILSTNLEMNCTRTPARTNPDKWPEK